MAERATLARPYAKALFSLAQQSNNLAPWFEQLSTLATVVASPKVAAAIDHPELSATERTALILSVDIGIEAGSALSNFVQILSENGRLTILPEIIVQYEQLMLAVSGVKKATIYSAFPLSDESLAQLLSDLSGRFGDKLDAHVEVKPELIGGVKIEIGDQVLDMSVQAQLNALHSAIIS